MVLSGALLLTVSLLAVAGMRFIPGAPLQAAPRWLGGGQSTPGQAAPGQAGEGAGRPTVAPSPSPSPLAVRPGPVKITGARFAEWALLDHRTGEVYGSKRMSATSHTASLVKAWIAADYLRRVDEAGREPSVTRLRQLSTMIRDSDNDTAIELYEINGGLSSGERMIASCGMTDSRSDANWSLIRLSPRDVARLGGCIADGRAAGRAWTSWLLQEMRLVRGVGDFGVRKAFPASARETIAIKNGWVVRDDSGLYEVNCLAVGDGWSVGVMTRYPAALDYTHGAAICQSVGAQLRVR
ncbi:serine hydrolase [Pilimelia columellifera subsp. columellifera]|uniref:Serine hydrolase n=1 Tax=Pilimelia columellifera subsp. columellifera TaxID=706583 RepID=A0ABP6ABX5_9ACTN